MCDQQQLKELQQRVNVAKSWKNAKMSSVDYEYVSITVSEEKEMTFSKLLEELKEIDEVEYNEFCKKHSK